MDSYTSKDFADEIRGNGSLLQGERCENPSANNISDMEKKDKKIKFKCRKNPNIITKVCH